MTTCRCRLRAVVDEFVNSVHEGQTTACRVRIDNIEGRCSKSGANGCGCHFEIYQLVDNAASLNKDQGRVM